jgi:hypothetical protein
MLESRASGAAAAWGGDPDMGKVEAAPVGVGAFLRALGGTGNVTLAAREAGLSRTRLYALRRRDPVLAGRWDKALAAARLRLAAAGEAVPRRLSTRGPSSGQASLEMSGKIAQRGTRKGPGELVRWRSKAGVQLTRARAGMLTPAKAARFLEVLRDCCNVTIACEVVGVRRGTAYAKRRACADFRAAWEEAKADGYDRIEMAAVAAAAAVLEGGEDAAELGGMSAATALGLLNYHARRLERGGGAAGPAEAEPDIEEVRAEVLRKVAAMERAGLVGAAGPSA